MQIVTTYQPQHITTQGYTIEVITSYTSFDKELIDDLESQLKNFIDTMLVTDIPDKEWKGLNSYVS